ncbi:MAG: hypothetical protein ACR2H2_01220 [Solirubrobacteraceae bacterium]
MRTFRRLNDGARYYGLTWQGWLACGVAGGVLYAAARFSPLDYRPTITMTLFVLAAAGMVLYAVSGQALGPGRYIAAFVRWRCGPARFVAPDATTRVSGGVTVDLVPLMLEGRADETAWWQRDEDTAGGPASANGNAAQSARLP